MRNWCKNRATVLDFGFLPPHARGVPARALSWAPPRGRLTGHLESTGHLSVMFAKGGGRTTRRGPAIARKRKGKRQGSAASSDGTPAAEKRRKQPPKASAEQGVRRSKRKASSLGGGALQRSERAARKEGETARRSMDHATREAACYLRDMSLLGPAEQGRRIWRISVAACYLQGLYSGTAPKTPARPGMWDGEGGTVALVPS